MVVGVSLVALVALVKLLAGGTQLLVFTRASMILYPSFYLVGSMFFVWGIIRSVPMLTHLSQAERLLQKTLEELGGDSAEDVPDLPTLAQRVQTAIQEHKRVLSELQSSQATNQALVSAMPDLMFQNSADGDFIKVMTPNHSQLFADPAEFIGKNVADVIPPPIGGQIVDGIQAALASNQIEALEYTLPLNGITCHFEARIVPCGDIGILSVIRDVTVAKQTQFALEAANVELQHARTQLEERVVQRTQELHRANQDLETLVYLISHDLKEPLRAIENFSALVNRRYASQLDHKGQDFLLRVVRASQRMRTLINDILNLSRAHRMEPIYEDVPAQTLIAAALERLEVRVQETDAQITIIDPLPTLHVNVTWATEAIYNLLTNALKYTEPDQSPQIEIVGYQEGDEIGITVRDQGIGVPPEHHERIFELFQRCVGRDIEGTGAGLAIVREVAINHGGRAWVTSPAAGGSEFTITFNLHHTLAPLMQQLS